MRVCGWYDHNQPGNWLGCVRHILGNVAKVTARDSSQTDATIQDLYTALCEDESIYGMFKSMKGSSSVHLSSRLYWTNLATMQYMSRSASCQINLSHATRNIPFLALITIPLPQLRRWCLLPVPLVRAYLPILWQPKLDPYLALGPLLTSKGSWKGWLSTDPLTSVKTRRAPIVIPTIIRIRHHKAIA